MQKLSVGVFGASGYSGLELVRLCSTHPGVELRFLTSDRWEGKAASAYAATRSPLHFIGHAAGEAAAAQCDVVFLATPAETSLALAARLSGPRVVDLSGAFRLKDAALYPKFYGFEHHDGATLASAVYGLPELFRAQIPAAKWVANPGCYATAAALSVAPLLKAKLIDPSSIVISAASGVSGAGRKASEDFSFMEIDADFRAYKVLKHQHTPEIDQTLSALGGGTVSTVFTPHLLPLKRGILNTSVATLNLGVTAAQVTAAFTDSYEKEPMIRLRESADHVRLAPIVHTSFTDVGFSVQGRRVVVTSALDNLLKGAAGQALQNFNLLAGFAETEGLL